MTKLLTDLMNRLAQLPPERQDEIAELILAELESETRWSESFARSEDVLDRLADEALEERAQDRLRPFDESALDKHE